MFAEVGYLTRNILVQGDPSSDVSKYGGHTINYGPSSTTTVYIRGITLLLIIILISMQVLSLIVWVSKELLEGNSHDFE